MNQVIFSILSHTYLKLKMAGEETEETRWYEGAIKHSYWCPWKRSLQNKPENI